MNDSAMVKVGSAPIALWGFEFTATGCKPVGSPDHERWSMAMAFAENVDKARQWWIGDLIAYGEAKFGELAAQMIDAAGYAEQTVESCRWVASNVPAAVRDPELSFSHHREVARLKDPAQQKTWLAKAKTENWSVSRLHQEVKAAEQPDDASCWLVVSCQTPADRDELADRLTKEGRTVKAGSGK